MPGLRKYVSDFTVSVGPINLVGALYGVRKSGSGDANKFTSVCPDCSDPVKPTQQYACPVDPSHVHPMSELHKAKEVDGTLVRVGTEEIAAARTSALPDNVFKATIHPVADVANATWHAENSYVFLPRQIDDWYNLLVRVVKESDKAFVAMSNVRNSEGFYRLEEWRGQLVLQRIHWPEECNAFEELEITCSDDELNAATAMMDRITVPFDAEAYRSTVRANLEALEAAMENGTPIPVPAVTPASPRLNLLAALENYGR